MKIFLVKILDFIFQKIKSYRRMIVIFSILIFCVLFWLLEYALPYMPIMPRRLIATEKPENYQLSAEAIEIPADDTLILRGYFVAATADTVKANLILVHGIGGCKENYFGTAKMLSENGYNVLLYDQRAHGQSGGKFCTFGYYEKRDVARILDFLEKRTPNVETGIWGSSLGGAVAIQSLAFDRRLKFGIIESTFNTLENVIVEYGNMYFGFKSLWLARRTLQKSAQIAGFEPFTIKPREACRAIVQPVFMAHGNEDERIPITFGKDNFDNIASEDKEFYEVKGAHHNDVSLKGGLMYRQKVLGFLNRVTQKLKQRPKISPKVKAFFKKKRVNTEG